MKLKLLGNKIAVEEIEIKNDSGIEVVGSKTENYVRGIVVAVSGEAKIKVGYTVYLLKEKSTKIKNDGKEYWITESKYILAFIQK